MYLVAIGWLYVTLMMAVVEAASSNGTVVGALLTFVLYGALPVSLAMYLLGTPARRRRRREQEATARARSASTEPHGGGEASAGAAVAPVREEA